MNELPRTFTMKELVAIAKIPSEDVKSTYNQLERMESYGLLTQAEDALWFKKDTEFEKWLTKYYRAIREKKEVGETFNPTTTTQRRCT
jgi:hypothetical protein